MSLPLVHCNLGGAKLLNITDLALPTALASGGSQTSNTIFCGPQGSVYILATMASGQMQVHAKVGASTPVSMSSGTTSVTLVGAGTTGYVKLDLSTTNTYAAFKLTDSNWSSALSSIDVFCLGSLSNTGFGWYNTDAPLNNATAVNSAVDQ